MEKEQNVGVVKGIRTDYGREFENENLLIIFKSQGNFHKFSTPKTPQQN